MYKIQIDMSVLADTIRFYESAINELHTCKSQMKSAKNTINTTWKGETKKAFDGILQVDWDKNINDYIDKLIYFKKTLAKVKTSYEAINQKANSL